MKRILIIGALTLFCCTNAHAACPVPQLPETSANGQQIPAATESLSLKDGTTVHLVPTGMGTSSIYYKVIRMDAQCKQTELPAQIWDGKKIVMSKLGEDDTLGCVDLVVDTKKEVIRCGVNSSASLKNEMTYKVSGDYLELLKVTESRYIDDTHEKRTAVYRNKKPHA